MKKDSRKTMRINDKIALIISFAICVISCVDVARYAILGNETAFWSMLIVNGLFILCAFSAWIGKSYFIYFPIAIGASVLFVLTNNIGTTLFNITFLFQAVLSGIGGCIGCIIALVKKIKPRKSFVFFLICILFGFVGCTGTWGVHFYMDVNKTEPGKNLWAVPTIYDDIDCPQAGVLEKLDYTTKAYATDNRSVQKSAYVYLPYDYEESKQYNILYLLHGTGDDESYWLKKFAYNKTMVDNLIYNQIIEPLIIVTPTFYVEDDCMDDLDALSYTFKEELKQDLMVAVESKYSTYADSCDAQGFINSREHRSFAGLSRGAVTTLHSVFCGSLDYFSSFGTFSASRTPVEYYEKINLSEEFKNYSIDYWYVASGAFDFGLVSQVEDYKAIVQAEPRLKEGVNTSIDVYPMQYHSMNNWHLALYNYLQLIFKSH